MRLQLPGLAASARSCALRNDAPLVAASFSAGNGETRLLSGVFSPAELAMSGIELAASAAESAQRRLARRLMQDAAPTATATLAVAFPTGLPLACAANPDCQVGGPLYTQLNIALPDAWLYVAPGMIRTRAFNHRKTPALPAKGSIGFSLAQSEALMPLMERVSGGRWSAASSAVWFETGVVDLGVNVTVRIPLAAGAGASSRELACVMLSQQTGAFVELHTLAVGEAAVSCSAVPGSGPIMVARRVAGAAWSEDDAAFGVPPPQEEALTPTEKFAETWEVRLPLPTRRCRIASHVPFTITCAGKCPPFRVSAPSVQESIDYWDLALCSISITS